MREAGGVNERLCAVRGHPFRWKFAEVQHAASPPLPKAVLPSILLIGNNAVWAAPYTPADEGGFPVPTWVPLHLCASVMPAEHFSCNKLGAVHPLSHEVTFVHHCAAQNVGGAFAYGG
eukprot:643980-Amphidinium_carterae.1